MPLRRTIFVEPIVGIDIHSVRFPLTDDGTRIIWGEVSDLALRERAMRDEVKDGLEMGKLFERYRKQIELLASEAFDEEQYTTEPDGTIVVRVTNGML